MCMLGTPGLILGWKGRWTLSRVLYVDFTLGRSFTLIEAQRFLSKRFLSKQVKFASLCGPTKKRECMIYSDDDTATFFCLHT